MKNYNEQHPSKRAEERSATSEKLTWLQALCGDQDITSNAFRVAFCLIQHRNNNTGIAFPSVQTIADKTGVSLRHVRRALDELKLGGWVSWRRTGSANHYTFLLENVRGALQRQSLLTDLRNARRKQVNLDMPLMAERNGANLSSAADHDLTAAAERRRPSAADKHTKKNTLVEHPSKVSTACSRPLPLPEDWQPSEDDLSFARQKGLNSQELGHEIEKFSNYYWGSGTPRPNWPATWRLWVLNYSSGRFGKPLKKPSSIM